MSSHLSPKSLLFYGTMIGSVVILFRAVSWYGEKNLMAPPNVAGQYISEQSLPGCPESTQLALTIQQSGVYLHGALRLVESSEESASQSSSVKEYLTLRGVLEQQNISLTGSALLPETCQIPSDAIPTSDSNSTVNQIPITIQGTVSEVETSEFRGSMTLGSLNLSDFTAVRESSAIQHDSAH